MTWLEQPTRYVFFTGKGGVGKTSLAAATAIALAQRCRRVLLVSTDAASNLDEMLGVPLRNQPVPVPQVDGLDLVNIDPGTAAANYRERVIGQLGPQAGEEEKATVREQLSGACTTEIASFHEFCSLLAGGAAAYEHVVFDTAPTVHTLRLLGLPAAWAELAERLFVVPLQTQPVVGVRALEQLAGRWNGPRPAARSPSTSCGTSPAGPAAGRCGRRSSPAAPAASWRAGAPNGSCRSTPAHS
jgi:anion-transporting  ArsA/GET3 family ATPase